MTVGDIYDFDKPSIWKKIGEIIGIICFLAMFFAMGIVLRACEEHQLCMNGAVEYCIPEDFQ